MSVALQRLVLVGSVLVDVLLYVDHLPERGGDALARQSVLTSGGGFNVLAGAARLGMPSAYAGRVGDGPFGAQVVADLAAAGIPLLLPRVNGADTGFDVGLIEADAERTFVTSPGVEARLTLGDLEAIPLRRGDAVYASGYDLCYPVSGAALGAWLPGLGGDQAFVIDPGPLVADIPPQRLAAVLARTDILSLNAREATHLAGCPDVAEAAALLTGRVAPDGWVVARAGDQGCWVAQRQTPTPIHAPVRSTRPIDTTGAGDAHVAALLARLAAGRDMVAAARDANVAASIAVGRRGPATGPTASELAEVLGPMPRFFPT